MNYVQNLTNSTWFPTLLGNLNPLQFISLSESNTSASDSSNKSVITNKTSNIASSWQLLKQGFKPRNLFSTKNITTASLIATATMPGIQQNGTASRRSSHFKTITEFTTDYSPSKITKYESLRTGMSVVVVSREV